MRPRVPPVRIEHVAIWTGDLDQARHWGRRDKAFFDFSYNADFSPRFASAQAVLKAALNLRGLPGGYPRPPYLPLSDEQVGRVRAFLEEGFSWDRRRPAGC